MEVAVSGDLHRQTINLHRQNIKIAPNWPSPRYAGAAGVVSIPVSMIALHSRWVPGCGAAAWQADSHLTQVQIRARRFLYRNPAVGRR